jgi:hypothetical protein
MPDHLDPLDGLIYSMEGAKSISPSPSMIRIVDNHDDSDISNGLDGISHDGRTIDDKDEFNGNNDINGMLGCTKDINDNDDNYNDISANHESSIYDDNLRNHTEGINLEGDYHDHHNNGDNIKNVDGNTCKINDNDNDNEDNNDSESSNLDNSGKSNKDSDRLLVTDKDEWVAQNDKTYSGDVRPHGRVGSSNDSEYLYDSDVPYYSGECDNMGRPGPLPGLKPGPGISFGSSSGPGPSSGRSRSFCGPTSGYALSPGHGPSTGAGSLPGYHGFKNPSPRALFASKPPKHSSNPSEKNLDSIGRNFMHCEDHLIKNEDLHRYYKLYYHCQY